MSTPKIRKPQTFGCVSPSNPVGTPIGIGASEVIKLRSGRFVKNDGSGRAEIAGNGHGTLMGFIEGADETAPATEGGIEKKLLASSNYVFRIPLRYDGSTYSVNYSKAIDGTKHDLVVVSSIQYANITDNSEGVIIIVGGQAATSITANDGFVLCKLNPETMWEA